MAGEEKQKIVTMASIFDRITNIEKEDKKEDRIS